MVDIATGILHSTESVVLGSWAWWRSIQGGFLEGGLKYDSGFVRALTGRLKAWMAEQ